MLNASVFFCAILYTLSHELTHISEHATDEYVELKTAVQEAMGAENWDTMVQRQLDIFKRTQPDKYNSMSEKERIEYASKEALAEACSDMLKDSDVLIKMAEDNPSLGKKIINLIKNLIAKISNWLANNSEVQAQEAKLLKETTQDLQAIVDKWDKAVVAGIKNQNAKQAVKDNSAQKQQKNNTDSKDGVEYSLNRSFSKNELNNNIATVTNMKSVANLNGNEFAKSETDLITQVVNYFNSLDNTVSSKYGEIELTRTGVKSSIGHGIGRNKAVAFTAIPEVINQGEIIDYQFNWKNRGYDTAVFAAPIKINDIGYYMAVVVNVEKVKNSYYLHEVALQKQKGNTPFKTGTVKNGTPSGALPSVYTLLQKIIDVNNQSMQNNKNNSTQYQARNTYIDYANTDLSTLDDKQLKVYNKRGWANALFTDEDFKLLQEKYNELNKRTKQRTDNVLSDGSRVVEVNNKLVLIGGTFEEPIIHNVLAINANNETEAEAIKEWIFYDSEEYKQSKTNYADNCESYESVIGKENVRNYNSIDFRYYKGRQDSGEKHYYRTLSNLTDILNNSKTEEEIVQKLNKEYPTK